MIELRDFLGMLKGVSAHSDGQYMAQCPAHDDKKASLAVKQGEKGLVMKCMAGCATEDIVSALGLEMSDLFYENKNVRRLSTGKRAAKTEKKKEPEQKAKFPADPFEVGGTYMVKRKDPDTAEIVKTYEKPVNVYVYEDENGNPVLQVARTDRKNFPVIHEDGGRWWWGDGGKQALLYHLPRVMEGISKNQRIYVVEGEKDVETLEKMGLYATTNKGGAGKWKKELSQALRGAKVVIIPDLDEAGRKHGRLIAMELDGWAREVRIMNLRKLDAEMPDKGDVSDLAERLGLHGAMRLIEELVPKSVLMSRVVDDSGYAEYYEGIKGFSVQNGAICQYKNDAWSPLCNFTALPVEEIVKDDGTGDLSTSFKVIGWAGDGRRLPEIQLSAETFAGMSWPLKKWGLVANVKSGNGMRERLREAIQAAGERSAVRRVAYSHTGWRKIDGNACYLHGGGAIGNDEAVVELDYGFNRYDLTGVVKGPAFEMEAVERMRYCVEKSLGCLMIAGSRVGAPLMGYMFLSPLRHFLMFEGHRPSFIPFVRGRTGSGKSVIASLILNHFGRDFSYDTTHPASFDDTVNGISLKLFVLKDMPLLIDDYHPEENPQRRRQMEDVAQRVSRMIGDGAKRSRMRNDTTGQEDKPARGLCIQTGEELPRVTESGVARMYVIDLTKGDVPIGGRELTELQQAAREGCMSETMKGYITWLLEQYEELPKKLDEMYQVLLKEALERVSGAHARIPPVLAHLMLGLTMMFTYFEQLGAISEGSVPVYQEAMWEALMLNTQRQVVEMADDKPTKLFVDTLRELIDSGKAVVEPLSSRNGMVPGIIGCRDREYYYLNPGQTYGAVQKSMVEQGTSFPLGKNMILKLLADEGLILKDPGTGKNVRQLNKGGVRAWVMWMPRSVLDSEQQIGMTIEGGEGR